MKSKEEIAEYKRKWRLNNLERLKKEAHERYMKNRVLKRQPLSDEERLKKRQESWRKYNQKPKAKYTFQKNAARRRGIDWHFNFETWLEMWMSSGKWEERGQSRTSFCMCRVNDVGPYSPTNCYIGVVSDNARLPRLRENGHLPNEVQVRPNKADMEDLKIS